MTQVTQQWPPRFAGVCCGGTYRPSNTLYTTDETNNSMPYWRATQTGTLVTVRVNPGYPGRAKLPAIVALYASDVLASTLLPMLQ